MCAKMGMQIELGGIQRCFSTKYTLYNVCHLSPGYLWILFLILVIQKYLKIV